MSKIVAAVNSMISNPDKISEVQAGVNECELFFVYHCRYCWSISRSDPEEDYFLHYYPGAQSAGQLATVSDWNGVPFITYKTSELKTREASESFAELYGMLRERIYGMDDVLDDIIRDMQE